jgi:dTDP-glucose pyrophosphorylase/CBS domain-containing protein
LVGFPAKRDGAGKQGFQAAMLDCTHLVETIRIRATDSIQKAISAIDDGKIGFSLVLDARGCLEGTLTDGDIRRGLLAGIGLSNSVSDILEHRKKRGAHVPVTAPLEVTRAELLDLMKKHVLRHIPLIDSHGVVRKIVTLEELVLEEEREIRALIMAGGLGKRLLPLTLEVPKPMLKLGGRPILEHILQRLNDSGIRRINISTHYLADTIKSYFKDGSDLGVEINYVHETEPLGTGGALSLMPATQDPILVMNGDILTDIDFRAMYAFHREHGAALTVAVGIQETTVPFGVVECDGINVEKIVEKPTLRMMISAGIYLVEPEVCELVQSGQPLDMPDLIAKMIRRGLPVIAFPLREGWIDIGTPEDYARAREHFATLSAAQPVWRPAASA